MANAFPGKVALVTGAASGIGRATAEAFARAGAAVVVADVQDTTGRTVADAIEAKGSQAIFARCDVAQEADIAGMVARRRSRPNARTRIGRR